MIDKPLDDSVKKFRPKSGLIDEELQRELDEALGGRSLEEVLAGETAAAPGAPDGRMRRGVVAAVREDDVFVDLGGKSQGVLSIQQFEKPPHEGDAVEVTIEGYDEGDGLLLLSRQGAVHQAQWETLQEGQILEGRVTGHNKGGLEMVFGGIRGFMPISQIELHRVEDLAGYLNQKMRCRVLEVDGEHENLVVSRRGLLEQEAAEAREKLFQSLAEGQTVTGTVRSIMPYGAFVDIGGVDGLLHVREMSHSRVEDPHQVVTEGQQILVKVLKVDRVEQKVSLGLKQILPDPWLSAPEKYPPDTVVSGRVTRLADFGAFVELESGVEGLIPMSELSFQRRIARAEELVKPGDVVRVRVLSVDALKRRIGLSLKRAGDDPWVGATVRWPAGSVVAGVVTRLAEFGAFVELAPGVEGLVHISQLSGDRVRAAGDAAREGQAVRVKVLSVDEDRRRISLSLKEAAAEEAQAHAAEAEAQAPAPPARKRKKPLKGGLE